MVLIAAMIIISIYLVCPIVGKIALLLANTILPDPIPFVDEFIMWVGLLVHLSRLMRVAEFIRAHKNLCIGVAIAIIMVVILLVVVLM